MNKSIAGIALLLALLTAAACSTDFEVYAPAKDIRIAFCVLNPSSKVQYVRIARAYQSDGDALIYAAEQDLSLKGLTMTLTGDGKTWTATELDTIPKDSGLFHPAQSIYAFTTDGSGSGKARLVAGKTYLLEIGTPEDSSYMVAHTTIPDYPVLTGDLAISSGSGTYKCLPRAELDANYPVTIKRAQHALGYEVKLFFTYEASGVTNHLTWDAHTLIRENKGCNEGSGNICYVIPDDAVINTFIPLMSTGTVNTYDRKDSCVLNPGLSYLYPRSVIFEATAVDSSLVYYIYANNPASFTDLNTVRPEYTNFRGNGEVAGILGSYSLDSALAIFNPCTEYLLGLNGTPKPLSLCE